MRAITTLAAASLFACGQAAAQPAGQPAQLWGYILIDGYETQNPDRPYDSSYDYEARRVRNPIATRYVVRSHVVSLGRVRPGEMDLQTSANFCDALLRRYPAPQLRRMHVTCAFHPLGAHPSQAAAEAALAARIARARRSSGDQRFVEIVVEDFQVERERRRTIINR